MENLIFISSTIIMLVFLLLLVWRGISMLSWLPPRYAWPFNGANLHAKNSLSFGNLSKNKLSIAEALFWFFDAIISTWVFVFIGFWFARGEVFSLSYFIERFTAQGDAPHYIYIAQNGYAYTGEKSNLIVFYPLYPLVLRVLALFVGSSALAGVIISNVCWGLSALILRRFAGRLTSVFCARVATLAMLFFPFAMFAIGVFTESLFMLLTLLCLEATEQKNLKMASLWGFLAALCRTQGVVLFIGAVFVCVFLYMHERKAFAFKKASFILLIPFGYCVYLWLNFLYQGDAFAFMVHQSAAPWYQSVHWLGTNLVQQWGMALSYPGLASYIYYPQIVLYFLAMALLIYGVFANTSIPILIYGGAYIGMSYFSGWLISGSRYVFGCVALYLVFAHIKNKYIQVIILLAEIAFYVYYVTAFIRGEAIM